MSDWLADHPEIRSVVTAISDLNGQARGKRLPVGRADKAMAGETKMPLSSLNVDIWGDDIENSPLVFETGDRDGLLRPTERGFVPTPWLSTPTAMLTGVILLMTKVSLVGLCIRTLVHTNGTFSYSASV